MNRPSAPTRHCPKCQKYFRQDDKFCSNCGENVRNEYNKKMIHFRAQIKRYNRQEQEIYNMFKKDALEWVGLSHHPKKNKIFAFAWDNEHDTGLYAVVELLEELEDLL